MAQLNCIINIKKIFGRLQCNSDLWQAVRALEHLASYETTFKAIALYEEEVVRLAMRLASTCLEVVYKMFVGVKDKKKRLRYHCDLLTRGVGLGDLEIENRKAE